jgi:hypothetical protein
MYTIMPCPYSALFGAPRTGAHSVRFAGLAVADTVVTIVAAFGVVWALNISFWTALLALVVFGEVLHYIFGTQTALLTALGIKVPTCE